MPDDGTGDRRPISRPFDVDVPCEDTAEWRTDPVGSTG
ncbi:MAG: hypothetical protein QOE89_424 [Pseudonocardiales bacterium]|jgi:hypothetical protein|nr:hypothetical protein [Pseudonocardiales bacterium]MDT5241765.1 hypothetical protein [Mycobacterium sp.]